MDQRERSGNLEEALLSAIEGRLKHVWIAIPGIVTSVHLSEMTVDVQPAIQEYVRDSGVSQTWIVPSVLAHVPLIFPSVGAFALTLPIAVGDEVVVVFSSRCIDAWWQQGGVQVQADFRMHSRSDGFAFPGPHSQPNVIPSINPNTCQLRKKDGSAYIELTAAGAVNIVAPGGFSVNGNTSVTGTLQSSGDGTFNGHSATNHVHSDPQGGNTGTPIG